MGVKRTDCDPLSPTERSALMAKVRSTGNISTEVAVAAMLRAAGIRGWRRQPKNIVGRPDFYFPSARLVLFVDGCFWHGCPHCQRNTPSARREFWIKKISDNRRRDERVRRTLRSQGYRVFRAWEHSLPQGTWLRRLQTALSITERIN